MKSYDSYDDFVKECEDCGVSPSEELLESRQYAVEEREEQSHEMELQQQTYQKTLRTVLDDPKKLGEFLSLAAHVPYSASNLLLVYDQYPAATEMRSYDLWKRNGAAIKRDARAIFISEPVKKYDKLGKCTTTYVKKARFDISQVEGYEPPERKLPDGGLLIKALISSTRVNMEVVPAEKMGRQDVPSYYDPVMRCVTAKVGLSEKELFASLAGSIAHARLSGGKADYVPKDHEFEAQCVVNILSRKYGFAKDLTAVKAVPEEIRHGEYKTNNRILNQIVNTFKAMDREMDLYIGRAFTIERMTERMERTEKTREGYSLELAR